MIFSLFSYFLSAQNIYDFEHSIKYADYLFSSEKYDKAAKEYERMLFFFPENDSLIFALSRAYLHSKQYEKSLSLIEPKTIQNDYKTSILYMNLLLLSNQFDKAKIHLSSDNKLSENEKAGFNARSLLYSGNMKDLKEFNLDEEVLNGKERQLFDEAKLFRPKTPVVALSLSLIPGLGKVYTKNYADAAMSFLTIGFCSFLAYRGYEKKGVESIPGWFYGGLGAGLYLGNFYGSFKAAKIHNQKFHEHLRNEMEEIIVSEN